MDPFFAILFGGILTAVAMYLGNKVLTYEKNSGVDIDKIPSVCALCGTELERHSVDREARPHRVRVDTDTKGSSPPHRVRETQLDAQRKERIEALRNIAEGKPAKPPSQSWQDAFSMTMRAR